MNYCLRTTTSLIGLGFLLFLTSCYCESEGDIRLVNGLYPWEGRVEVFSQGRWGTVCDDGWGTADAKVVCRQLGYNTSHAVAVCCAHHGSGDLPINYALVACNGSENTLASCHKSYYQPYCYHNEDAAVACHPATCEDDEHGAVRLVGLGSAYYNGRLEVCMNGNWGTVCRHGWTDDNAYVVCRQLGYKSHNRYSYYNPRYVEGSGPIFLSNVSCNTSESQLLDCPYETPNNHCNHNLDVGILCVRQRCNDGDVRLVDGDSFNEGRLELCLRERWGPVSDEGWSTENAQVVCSQLGFSAEGANTAYFGEGIEQFLMCSVSCVGFESTLLECSHNVRASQLHGRAAGVQCRRTNCHDGDIQMRDGEAVYEGRVELCHSGVWGTISDHRHHWSAQESMVVCRQLGYKFKGGDRRYGDYSLFETGNGPIWLDYVRCSGHEDRLLHCTYHNSTYDSHKYDVGFSCSPYLCNDWDVRLTGGDVVNEGRLELCLHQSWGTVSDSTWSKEEVKVVCRQLGYSIDDAVALPGGHFGVGSGPVLVYDLVCYGTESSLLDCSRSTSIDGDRDQRDPGVFCSPYSCKDGDVRLNGLSEFEGVVEVCLQQRWGSVCSDGWSVADANVTCQQLGYSSDGVTPYSYTTRHVSGIQLIKHIGCFGQETGLLECSYSLQSDGSGSNCEDVAVHCIPATPDTPATPTRDTLDTPVTSDTPTTSDSPDTPTTPDTPDTPDTPATPDAEVEQQQLQQASANQNSYNALTVVLAVIVAVVVVVLAVIVAGKVWSIIKKKDELKDSYNFKGLQEKVTDDETDGSGLATSS